MENLSYHMAIREWVPYGLLPHPQRLLSWWAAPRDAEALDHVICIDLWTEEPWRA